LTSIDSSAPVRGSARTRIDASAERIWSLITDIARWPAWNPDISSAALDGDLAEGAVFRWKAGPGTITSRISRIEEPGLISWTGRTMGIRAVHVWRIEKEAGSALVSTEESWNGILPKVLRWPLRKMLQDSLEAGLRHLREEAERCPG